MKPKYVMRYALDPFNFMLYENTQLMEENAKLRELVADMWTCVSEGEWDCSDCPRYARCDDGVSEFRNRARELGIEVS